MSGLIDHLGDPDCPHAAYRNGLCIHCGRRSNRSIERERRREARQYELVNKPRRQMGLYELLLNKGGFDMNGDAQ